MKFVYGKPNRAYVKNAFVISFVYSIFRVASENDFENDESVEGLMKIPYKFEEGMKEMLDDWIENLTDELFNWLKVKCDTSARAKASAMTKDRTHMLIAYLAQYDVNLEVLGAYIMYHNFVARTEPLHIDFQQFTDKTRYEMIVDTLSAAGFGNGGFRAKANMHNLAKNLLERI